MHVWEKRESSVSDILSVLIRGHHIIFCQLWEYTYGGSQTLMWERDRSERLVFPLRANIFRTNWAANKYSVSRSQKRVESVDPRLAGRRNHQRLSQPKHLLRLYSKGLLLNWLFIFLQINIFSFSQFSEFDVQVDSKLFFLRLIFITEVSL